MIEQISKFKEDYFVMTQKHWDLLGVLRIIKHRNLRYCFWARLACGQGLIAKYAEYRRRRHENKYGLEISMRNIAGGLFLAHPFNITVNPGATLGKNVTLFKGSTIGSIRSGKREGVPVIGDRVTICCNAMVCGNINIGNDVLVSANAFVNFDVPAHSVVIGNPGKIYDKENASKDYLTGL